MSRLFKRHFYNPNERRTSRTVEVGQSGLHLGLWICDYTETTHYNDKTIRLYFFEGFYDGIKKEADAIAEELLANGYKEFFKDGGEQ